VFEVGIFLIEVVINLFVIFRNWTRSGTINNITWHSSSPSLTISSGSISSLLSSFSFSISFFVSLLSGGGFLFGLLLSESGLSV
jgi:hypothetical protein